MSSVMIRDEAIKASLNAISISQDNFIDVLTALTHEFFTYNPAFSLLGSSHEKVINAWSDLHAQLTDLPANTEGLERPRLPVTLATIEGVREKYPEESEEILAKVLYAHNSLRKRMAKLSPSFDDGTIACILSALSTEGAGDTVARLSMLKNQADAGGKVKFPLDLVTTISEDPHYAVSADGEGESEGRPWMELYTSISSFLSGVTSTS